MTLLLLMARRHRLPILCWVALLIALSGPTLPAYRSTYATVADRRIAVALAQHDAATTLMYGRLPDPGTPALMFAWEIGAIVTVLAAVAAVLLATMLTRAAEDNGTLELVRACGVPPHFPVRDALVLLAAVASVLTAGCTAAAVVSGAHVEGADLTGALSFGAVIGITFLLFGVLTVGLAQVAATAGQTRLLGFLAVGAAFAVRAMADTRDLAWLNGFTPLGLRATTQPFGADRWIPPVVALTVTAALAVAAAATAAHREYGAGILPRRDTSTRRLPVRTVAALSARLTRTSLIAWTAAVTAISGLFCAMGAGAVTQPDLGGFLGAQVGAGDRVAGYLSYCGTVTGIIVSVFGILAMLTAGHDERTGLTALVLTTGRRRWAPLGAQAAVTAAGGAIVLLAAAALSAVIAPVVIDGPDVTVRTLGYLLGQWPAVVALIGITTLLLGLRPSWAGLAWLPLTAGALFALLGDLFDIPGAVQRLGVFRHVPDVAAADGVPLGLIALLAVGAATCLLGLLAARRRDLVAG
ncbi:hypothetical protein JIG36_12760 [Actinoplanes sp. LDG1-06]|uniref:ABC transporter permease n=1 Tax=Paractinoplanes ovalisporus TaxID=2810368 RepID=A0ABS2AAY7_9ACTN|nr:hypothetical protein [Actinoplanes ovalisporus]MBM2616429.1 hypothetical protein [Actinoplanes ovalisporus]